jgi:hypothetical protein
MLITIFLLFQERARVSLMYNRLPLMEYPHFGNNLESNPHSSMATTGTSARKQVSRLSMKVLIAGIRSALSHWILRVLTLEYPYVLIATAISCREIVTPVRARTVERSSEHVQNGWCSKCWQMTYLTSRPSYFRGLFLGAPDPVFQRCNELFAICKIKLVFLTLFTQRSISETFLVHWLLHRKMGTVGAPNLMGACGCTHFDLTWV